MENTSRQDLNKQVKVILVRRFVDLTMLQYSCSQNTVSFTGHLRKYTGEDYSFHDIEAIIRELRTISQVRFIRFKLDNWDISTEGNSFQIQKKKRGPRFPHAGNEPKKEPDRKEAEKE